MFPSMAKAGLGGDRPQIKEDAQKLGLVQVRTGSGSGYSTVTLALPEQNGPGIQKTLTIKEYLDLTGRIFAIAWKGSVPPDLSVILGSLFSRLSNLPPSQSRHRLFYQDDHLVLSVVGSGRFRVGRVWNPQALPTGFSPSQIRIMTP